MARTLLVILASLLLDASPVGDGPKTHIAEMRRLKEYLARPGANDRYFEADILPDVRVLAGDPEAEASLRDAFEKRWLSGRFPEALTLDRFRALAAACPPFGPDRAGLLDAIARHPLPVGRDEPGFRAWLRGELSAIASAADRLLAEPARPPVEDFAARYEFLLDVLPERDAARVRARFDRDVWPKVAPESMAVVVRGLAEREGKGGFARPAAIPESRRIIGALGDQLFRLDPDRWAEAGDSLKPLAAASSRGAPAVFDRAVNWTRDRPPRRDDRGAELLRKLGAAMPPRDALARLRPARDLEWLIWLHSANVLPALYSADPSGEAMADGLKAVAALATAETYPRLAPGVIALYYGDARRRDAAFESLIRRHAGRGDAARLVREPLWTGDRTLEPRHRSRLALDALASEPAAAAWGDDGAPSRLRLAVAVYSGLVEPAEESRDGLRRHVGHAESRDGGDGALLAAILDAALVDLPGAADALNDLVKHLGECQQRGADLRGCEPLERMERRVGADVRESIAKMQEGPGDARPVVRFVERLALALRLRGLLRPLGRQPEWLADAIRALRRSVFGLADGATPAWDPPALRAKADRLRELDAPLRDVLAAPELAEDRRAVFNDLYVPLARVPGFLRTARGRPLADGSWPHRAWAEAGPPPERLQHLQSLFRALRSGPFIDAEDALADLALAHLEALKPGLSAWEVEPKDVFAGAWGVNANARVWRRLLDARPPGAHGEWRLAAIAERSARALREGALARTEIAWAVHVVTASEWQASPFRDTDGRALPRADRLRPSGPADRPFAFGLRGGEASRRVDGSRRMDLVDAIRSRPESRQPPGPDGLLELAAIVALLPNGPDNDASPPDVAEHSRRARRDVYAELSHALGIASDAKTKTDLLRAMMRLHVANRGGPPLEPAFDRVAEGFRARPDLDAARGAVLIEKAEMEAFLGPSGARSPVAEARTRVDRWLDDLSPKGWLAEDRALRNASFQQRLASLDEENVRILLRIRRDVRQILADPEPKGARDPERARDLDRVEKALDLVDSFVWFRRPDFQPADYRKVTSRGGEPWWPALVVLGWADADLQAAALDRCDEAEGPASARVRLALFQLGEAAYATMAHAAGSPDGAAMLEFRHDCTTTSLDLRLLADTTSRETATGETLARDGFRGVLHLLRIAGRADELPADWLEGRLFATLEGGLPPGARRPEAFGRMNVASVARFAAGLEGSDRAIRPLREAAGQFLDRGAEGLLSGARDPEGLVRLAEAIPSHYTADDPPRYRAFLENMIVHSSPAGPPRLSEGFIAAMSRVFFARDLDGQRASVERLIARWRKLPRGGAGSRIGEALRADLLRVVLGLVHGDGRGAATAYLWKPADDLAREPGPRESPPSEFFRLAAWWAGLASPDDPPEARRAFAIDARGEAR